MIVTRRKRPAVSNSTSITAPIGGLNARDSLAAMPVTDAITLTNFFPTPTTVNLRNGYEQWVTGLPADVESLMPYVSGTASKLFAASGTAFYDVTTKGAVGASVVSGLTNARWQSANMGTPGGRFLYAVNGNDKPRYYDGASWVAVDGASTPAITGVTTTLLCHVNVFKNRLYFVERDSLRVWYLPINSIGGAAASFDLSSIFKAGGYLMAMTTWTVDNAAGIQEYAVFITSEGEIALYQGYDPSSSGSWAIAGMFMVGRPIGRRCFCKVGSDLNLITEDGVFPLSKVLLTDRTQLQDALTNKIVNLVNNDVQNYGDNWGWDICFYPLGNKLIINVPQVEGATQYQYVMNAITGAWCKFTGWNANCWAVMGDTLYFGGNLGSSPNTAYVARADYGHDDAGGYIFGEVKQAFSYFDSPGRLKRWSMIRPIFYFSGQVTPSILVNTDFDDTAPVAATLSYSVAGTAWNTALWNTFPWGSTGAISQSWQHATGIGYCAALHMKVANNYALMQWMATDYVYEPGAIL